MLQILIVDDEAIERDGIKFLIRKFGLELAVLEAENGEEALEVLAAHPVDILFTDIKMPFMDGLELCRSARERYAGLRIIIYSAYGEFEYAQQAIRYGIHSYVLKPIDVQEFTAVLTGAMELCRQEKALEAQQITLREGYHKGLVYEKEKLLLDLIGGRADGEVLEALSQAGVALSGRLVRMILVHFEGRFFGRNDAAFQEDIRETVREDWELLHLNESQCLLLVLTSGEQLALSEAEEGVGERLRRRLLEGYGQPCTVVVGRPETPEGLKDEYERMEGLLENQFFYKEGTVFYTDRAQAGRPLPADALTKLLDRLYWHLEAKDDYGFRRGMGLFFETVRRSGQHSVIYTKYLCMELTRKALQTAGREAELEWSHYVEGLFSCRSLEELEFSVQKALDLIPIEDTHAGGAVHTKKVIKDVVGLIEDNYMHDISLSWIAEQVHLTQTYLSYLFSREKGQPLIKYITGLRMQKAAELLRETHLTVAQISERAGYTSDSYFGKIFKNHYGVSPAKYREMSS